MPPRPQRPPTKGTPPVPIRHNDPDRAEGAPPMSDSSLVLPESTTGDPAVAGAAADSDAADPGPGPLVLEAPAPVGAVAPATATDAVPISIPDREKLDAMVAAYLDAVSGLDPHGTEFSD